MRMPGLAVAVGFAVAVCAAPVLAQEPTQQQVQGPIQSQEAPKEPAQIQLQSEPQAQPQPPPQDVAPAPTVPQDSARDVAAPKQPARFTFIRVDNGFLRLDSASGQVALCRQRAVGWACEAVPEERAALQKEIARLRDEVTGLKTEIAALRMPPPPPAADLSPPIGGNGDAKIAEPKIPMPTREDIERARAAIEKAWQRLVDMVVGLQKDMMRKG